MEIVGLGVSSWRCMLLMFTLSASLCAQYGHNGILLVSYANYEMPCDACSVVGLGQVGPSCEHDHIWR